MRKVKLALTLSIMLLSPLGFAQESVLGDRANVMECSHDEVVAYMDLPNPERKAMSDFHLWQSAYQSTESKKAESDPQACLALLYGDLGALVDKMKAATNSLMSTSIPSMSEIASKLTDAISKSICKRMQNASTDMKDAVMDNLNRLKDDARKEVIRRYGQRAMEKMLTEAVIPPEYRSMGLKYRNGALSKDSFRRSVKKRWENELDGLKDEAVDGLQ